MHVTGWSRGLEVSGGGQGVVSHAGLALLRQLADMTGLTGGLSRALATARILVHDQGRVTADLAYAIADGARVISDFRVMSDQRELFGLVASVPTAWRTLAEIARAGTRAVRRITAAVSVARRHAWAQVAARHGALPGIRMADRTLDGVTCIRAVPATAAAAAGTADCSHGQTRIPPPRPRPRGRKDTTIAPTAEYAPCRTSPSGAEWAFWSHRLRLR